MQPKSVYGQLATALQDNWRLKARPSQLPPPGDWWSTWLVLPGRGWGKTLAGSNWVCELAMASVCRIALIAPTAADCRDILIEGATGVLASAPSWCRPVYEPSKRVVRWGNGSQAHAFSGEEPDRLRGMQFHWGWWDEACSTPNKDDVWNMYSMGLRLGERPRTLITTTPKPSKFLNGLLARENKEVVVVRGTTYENEPNLAPGFIEAIKRRYENTRIGRQEILGEVLNDTPGALWQIDWLDRDRVTEAPKELRRIVVAVDPAVSNNEGSDETGIIVCGVGQNGHGYVLEDLSGRYAPHEWAARAVAAFRRHRADRVVIEANQGGLMASETLRTQDRALPIKAVHASRGKVTRAEPIATLYEQGRVHHVGTFPQLEDQLTSFTSDFDRSSAGFSPDRLDALVWGFSELLIRGQEPLTITPPFYASAPRNIPGGSSSGESIPGGSIYGPSTPPGGWAFGKRPW
jgi:phage terminase large subunit-like protein